MNELKTTPAELSVVTRGQMIEQMLREPLDVLVIGGGVTGAGVALDAATRGLRVGLIERDDFGCGTSSRSSKMIHGGLRYLATGDVRLVREALRERRGIQWRAAHLVRPLPMLLPMFGRRWSYPRMKYGAGLWAYDLLGAWQAGSRHRWLNRDKTLEQLPNVRSADLAGSLAYRDSQADDARLVIALVRTAAAQGALVANGVTVEGLLTHGGRVTGARAREDNRVIEIEAAVVVNATGVWADQLQDSEHPSGLQLLPSKGIHLTVDRETLGIRSGAAFFAQTGNSNVFVEPWSDDLAIIGTTDEPYSGDLATPAAEETEITGLLQRASVFLDRPIARGDVIASWAGLRPLVQESGTTDSEDVSRDHSVAESPGLVTLVGGKLTTYRQMAQDGIDAAVTQILRLGRTSVIKACQTDAVRLLGASEGRPSAAQVARECDVPEALAEHLVGRYGDEAGAVAALASSDRGLLEVIHPDRPYIGAEVVWAGRYEMARSSADVVERRTRLALETRDGGGQATAAIEALLLRASVF